MSLSKYYKNSNSFQPEELIKRDGKISAGWQSLSQSEGSPFQSEKVPVAAPPTDETPAHEPTEPTKTDIVPDTVSEETIETKPNEVPSKSVSLLRDIDLSNYMERIEAEEKIEAAYEKGLNEGKEKTEQDFETATRSLLSACQQLDTVREIIIGNSSNELKDFALSIAERILRISVREQDETIIATIEEALQRAVKSDEFTVYIHPDDFEIVSENSTEIIAGLSGLNKIVIKKDITIERGGAKIESDNCTIDATIASQFDVIREEIKKNLSMHT
ncbi:MAG: FliH/SctL family protein [Desulforhopalus sp.]